MWGYDRGEHPDIVPHKTQEEQFRLFCMVLERGFAIHTGSSDRLLVEFRLADTHHERCLPRVTAKRGVSFRIPEQLLQTGDLYLYFDPAREGDMPELAHFNADTGTFTPFDYRNEPLLDCHAANPLLPVVKLATLKGLHYTKDIACLQLYQLDFQRLLQLDPALAQQLRETLVRKMARFIEFADPWLQATLAEQAAREYLEYKAQRLAAAVEAASASRARLGLVEGKGEPGFLTWE
ncbi:hypothetical protein [Pseudomaricurvus sp. HS19]|uniref:hypothetical protein n=1 Tax=Pseudomaricurvus sp. HS19 TaxID=2692626 RepID=UPI00136A80D8|nr:hypothetical protein [Pseudomaricurvus sp. HS19]MYM62714.1 hypothetical protein [Pseudomaricurvus sp. HS19]